MKTKIIFLISLIMILSFGFFKHAEAKLWIEKTEVTEDSATFIVQDYELGHSKYALQLVCKSKKGEIIYYDPISSQTLKAEDLIQNTQYTCYPNIVKYTNDEKEKFDITSSGESYTFTTEKSAEDGFSIETKNIDRNSAILFTERAPSSEDYYVASCKKGEEEINNFLSEKIQLQDVLIENLDPAMKYTCKIILFEGKYAEKKAGESKEIEFTTRAETEIDFPIEIEESEENSAIITTTRIPYNDEWYKATCLPDQRSNIQSSSKYLQDTELLINNLDPEFTYQCSIQVFDSKDGGDILIESEKI